MEGDSLINVSAVPSVGNIIDFTGVYEDNLTNSDDEEKLEIMQELAHFLKLTLLHILSWNNVYIHFGGP